ncbi:MAG: hypothetical protein ABI844_00055 [Saprospiraceae bacterium]
MNASTPDQVGIEVKGILLSFQTKTKSSYIIKGFTGYAPRSDVSSNLKFGQLKSFLQEGYCAFQSIEQGINIRGVSFFVYTS